MKKFLLPILSFSALFLGACLSPQPCDSAQMAIKSIKFSNTKLLAGKIQLDEIRTERTHSDSRIETTELGKALAVSLMFGKVYSADAGRYLLSVEIIEERAPATNAFDYQETPFTVTEHIRYSLRTRERGILVFRKEIQSEGSASKEEARWGEVRLRLAKERAVKNNIEKFLAALNREFGKKAKRNRNLRK